MGDDFLDMPDLPPRPSAPPPAAGPDGATSPVLAQLLANGWLAGHGTTQQLESFLDAMRAVGAAESASWAAGGVAHTGSWAAALPTVPGGCEDNGERTTRGS